jgi:hypothetical protein
MPRRLRPAQSQRSEHWLRVAVNERTDVLNFHVRQTLHLAANDPIEWLSPIAEDAFAEYYDEAFLERLKVAPILTPLHEFWPESGPRWDGLARTQSGKLIIVEAKAYVEEAVDFKSKAGDASLKRIRAALTSAKGAFRAAADANWEEPFYQYANRLAHLYYLRSLNRCDAYLLFLCFADAPDVPTPSTTQEWQGAIRTIEKALGLGTHPYRPYIGHLILNIPEMLSNPFIESKVNR